MKLSWLSQFRVWSTIDGENPSNRKSNSPDVAHYTKQAVELDRLLRRPAPPVQSPPGLHEHIMARVRAGNRPQPRPHSIPLWKWLAAAASCLLVLIVALQMAQPSALPQTRPHTTSTTTQTQLVTSLLFPEPNIPKTILDPLNNELDQLGRDLQAAKTYLLASIP